MLLVKQDSSKNKQWTGQSRGTGAYFGQGVMVAGSGIALMSGISSGGQ